MKRGLTTNEKKLINALIDNYNPNGNVRIGDVLLKVYDIVCIESVENKYNIDLYEGAINCEYRCNYKTSNCNKFTIKIFEAISLIQMLIKKGYIIIHKFKVTSETIGTKSSMANFYNPKTGDGMTQMENIIDMFGIDLWKLVNSNFVITNGLIIFKGHHYKDPNEWNNDRVYILTIIAILVSLLIGIFSILRSYKDVKIEPTQIHEIINVIKNHQK